VCRLASVFPIAAGGQSALATREELAFPCPAKFRLSRRAARSAGSSTMCFQIGVLPPASIFFAPGPRYSEAVMQGKLTGGFGFLEIRFRVVLSR
jgi:hypothetical protein